ncbi:hypothetical protein OV450_6670, partial [Actinobacteria bacterium OV450]
MTPSASTLAFVESPVQLLNVLEWAHTEAVSPPGGAPLLDAVPRQPSRAARGPAPQPGGDAGPAAGGTDHRAPSR